MCTPMFMSSGRRTCRSGALAVILGLLFPVAVSAQQGSVPALYATQAEAEKAARLHLNCTGAHRMGDQWMPCAQHGGSQSGGHVH